MMKSGIVAGFVGFLCFGLLACSESSPDIVKVVAQDYCEVVSTDPLTIESVEDGYYSKTTFVYDNQIVNESIEFGNADIAKQACSSYRYDSDYDSVKCSGKYVTAVGKEIMSESTFDKFKKKTIQDCNAFNKSNDTVKVQSSSSVKIKSSSSSAVRSSSSSEKRSSSSSKEFEGEKINWIGNSWYIKEKVVAANTDELKCEDKTNLELLSEYDVAYEFNNPNNLGHDYLGHNDAYLDGTVSPITAECGSAVFDGTNGLLVPLDDVFKSKGFVVEVRFMPTKAAAIGNLIAAEPPGSGVDGWQIRLSETDVFFLERDVDLPSEWVSHRIGDVSLNEWHTVRVKIYPSKSGLGVYMLQTILDEDVSFEAEYEGDLSNLRYGLGIAYDAMHQSAYGRKFFTGKIDYIRYGKIAESGL